jgi:hypothetical protein
VVCTLVAAKIDAIFSAVENILRRVFAKSNSSLKFFSLRKFAHAGARALSVLARR